MIPVHPNARVPGISQNLEPKAAFRKSRFCRHLEAKLVLHFEGRPKISDLKDLLNSLSRVFPIDEISPILEYSRHILIIDASPLIPFFSDRPFSMGHARPSARLLAATRMKKY